MPDLNRAKKFYEEEVGLSLVPDDDARIVFKAGPLHLHLMEDKNRLFPRFVRLWSPDLKKATLSLKNASCPEIGKRFLLPSGTIIESLSMPESGEAREDTEPIVDLILDVEETMSVGGSTAFELWKHYQDRADHIKTHLWTTGTWLLAIIVAVLSIPFTAKFISIEDGYWPLDVSEPMPVAFLSFVGILLCIYSLFVIRDFKDHVAENWARADYLKKREVKRIGLAGTTRATVRLLWMFVGALALPFIAILVAIYLASAETVQLLIILLLTLTSGILIWRDTSQM